MLTSEKPTNVEASAPPAYPVPPQGPFAATTSYPSQGQTDPVVSEAMIGKAYRDQLFAQCARGEHDRVTKFGACGIITAAILFPIGLLCLFCDKEVRCARCGVRLQ